jgi:lipopolysaccharide biosynthesis glycosyltransferase
MHESSVSRISVCFAADNNYARPLASAILSLAYNCRAKSVVDIYVLDGGIHQTNRKRIEEMLVPYKNVRVLWLIPDQAALTGLNDSGHVSLVTYYRILIPDVLPISVERVIYLDCDLIINGDISELWNANEHAHTMAVRDAGLRFVSNPSAIRDFQQFGLEAEAHYFNAGVLVINVHKWRSEDISIKLLKLLNQHSTRFRWWDQDALNIVLNKRWQPLDPIWNQLPAIFQYREWSESPYSQEQFEQAVSGPAIVHYASSVKPWKTIKPDRRDYLFYHYLDMTPWRGWRYTWLDKIKKKILG